jgi:RNA-binding protein YlmH
MGPPDAPTDVGGVSAIEIKGNFMFDPATHRDFLGAMLGAGCAHTAAGAWAVSDF